MVTPVSRNRARRAAIFVLALISVQAFAVHALAAQEAFRPAQSVPLWTRAVALYRANEDQGPTRMDFRVREYRGSGKLMNDELISMSIEYGPKSPKTAILNATKNGKDVTEETRKNPNRMNMLNSDQGKEAGSSFASLFKSPFDPKEQKRVLVRFTGVYRSINGSYARQYDFTHKTADPYINSGTVWLNARTGAPISMDVTVAPLPAFVDNLAMQVVFEFSAPAPQEIEGNPYPGIAPQPGTWHVRRAILRAGGHILFFARRYLTELEFLDYRAKPSGLPDRN
jgi:hypothetical protein